ncbi:MAG: outer membrane beta-barrel protein [Rhodothermales bacterium]
MKRYTSLLLILLVALSLPAAAQQQRALSVTGAVVDAEDGSALPGVTVVLLDAADSVMVAAGTSGPGGRFAVRAPREGTYRLRLSFVGFVPHVQDVAAGETPNDVGSIRLEASVTDLDEVVVQDVQERFRMRGDTAVFNADAYRVNPDASAEDLIGKMPGVVLGQDGTVEAQGEQVQRVTVDGREFFGDDPAVALRNLPADVIQNIEIFDRESDQAQFTGFSDGNTERTINIVTRTGMSNGQFGKAYGGYGESNRYITGGNTNIFDGDRRISVIALANNVNQQNFAFEDLLGITGGGNRRFVGGGPGGGGGGAVFRGGGGGGRGGGGGFNPRDFLVGQQGGLNTTTSVGLNYSDNIGSSLRMSASYFFNRMENANDAFTDRQLFLPDEQTQFYNETTQSSSTNYNHRLSGRLEYTFDENNSLLIRPNLSFQDNAARTTQNGANMLTGGTLLNEALSAYASSNVGYTSSTEILYRHRFATPGRTLSAQLDVGMNDRWGDTEQFSVTEFYDESDEQENTTYDQEIDSKAAGRSVSLSLDVTESLDENSQLRLSYEPSYGKNVSDRSAYVLDLQTGRYVILDPTFSSLFDNDAVRQRGGASMQHNFGERFELQLGVEAQNERLLGDQTYPVAFELDRSFFSVLPEAEIEYDFGEQGDVELRYRTRTNTPSVSQLQDVVDNTNPLFLQAGNRDLEPSYTHTVSLRGRRGNWQAGRMTFGFMSVDYQRNPIGTASLLAARDTVLFQGVLLQQGAQFSQPVNLSDASINARSFVGVGLPFPLLESNLNLRGGVSYARTPGLINGQANLSTQYSTNGGVTVASNISEQLDFTLSYGGAYTVASNSFYERLDENYYRHDAGVRFTWLPLGRLVLETSLTFNDYVGLDEALYPTTFIMNAGLGYKFLRQNAAEAKLVVGDIFNQETGIRRTITESYIEDSNMQVLGRYVLLNLTYTFRNFGL